MHISLLKAITQLCHDSDALATQRGIMLLGSAGFTGPMIVAEGFVRLSPEGVGADDAVEDWLLLSARG